MTTKLLKGSLLVLACSGLTAGVVLAQSGGAKDAAKDAVKDAKKAVEDAAKKAKEGVKDAVKDAAGNAGHGDEQKMMEEMMKGMQPGAMHAWLKGWEGQWECVIKSYWSPGAPPEESKSSVVSTMIMGGRYLEEKVTGSFDMPGAGAMQFEGRSIVGYDNAGKKFNTFWIDNFGTGFWFESGTVDAAGKVLTTEGENFDPMVNANVKTKSVATVVDHDHRTLEMWGPGPDGKMFKKMEIAYTRKH